MHYPSASVPEVLLCRGIRVSETEDEVPLLTRLLKVSPGERVLLPCRPRCGLPSRLLPRGVGRKWTDFPRCTLPLPFTVSGQGFSGVEWSVTKGNDTQTQRTITPEVPYHPSHFPFPGQTGGRPPRLKKYYTSVNDGWRKTKPRNRF